jgi:hypothetical protein
VFSAAQFTEERQGYESLATNGLTDTIRVADPAKSILFNMLDAVFPCPGVVYLTKVATKANEITKRGNWTVTDVSDSAKICLWDD